MRSKFVISIFSLIHTLNCFRDDGNHDNNLKRESKVYSYQEQLEEQQLRRELEEKKRKAGKVKLPQYTPKQLEAIKNQRLKEQDIRNRLTEVILISQISYLSTNTKFILDKYINFKLYLNDKCSG